MRIISRKTLRDFWQKPSYADAEQPLKAWYKIASEADWAAPAAVKAQFSSASVIGDSRIVFNIAGNKYRLVVKMNYAYRIAYIRFVGTHFQYDAINIKEI
jgi:mRNA interferase HigB